jgi:putative restriction endonuclease
MDSSVRIEYSNYLTQTNINGSGKATSYIRALDLLSEMLITQAFGFEDCIDIWCVSSLKRIAELRELVATEQRKGKDSIWLYSGIAPSYLINGYCKAALSSYAKFLAERTQENNLFGLFEKHKGDAVELSNILDSKLVNLDPENIQVLLDGLKGTSGEDIIRSIKTRLNQNVFRRMLINIYNGSCCITGINIPEVNRASHIIPWADCPSKRLDPSNGLYLSATYDAAFDKHLISLDDDYRIIVSKVIKDHYTNESVTEYFIKKEGDKINLPSSYLPNQKYLAKHRNIGRF